MTKTFVSADKLIEERMNDDHENNYKLCVDLVKNYFLIKVISESEVQN